MTPNQLIRTSLIGQCIFASDRQIELFAGTVEDELREHPMRWRMTNCFGGFRDGKDVAALPAGRRSATCRARVQIKPVLAVRTASLLVVDIRRENPGTLRADHADFWFAVGISVSDKNVGRKQIHVCQAVRTGKCLDPKKIERVANVSLVVSSLVECPDALANTG